MKILYFTILFISSHALFAQEKKCTDFKTGKFRYKDSNLKDWIIIRNDTLQIETNKFANIEAQGSIKWKSDCEYELVYTKSSFKEFIGKKISSNISNIQNEEFLCRSNLDGQIMNFEMVKVE
jgi:hypothetical protein